MQRLIQSQQGSSSNQSALQRLSDKPFWLWDSTRHKDRDIIHNGNCCFNHIIGLPRKNGVKKPIFDCEWMLYKALLQRGYLNSDPSLLSSNPNNVKYCFKEKHLWVKKAKPKKSEMPPSFKEMQRHGVKITSYTTTEDR